VTDPLHEQLAALAPEVDVAASHARFDRQRRAARRAARHRRTVAAGVVAIVGVVLAVGLVRVRQDDVSVGTGPAGTATVGTNPGTVVDPTATSTMTTSTTIRLPLFEVLAATRTREPMGTLRGTVDGVGLSQLWSQAGNDTAPPAIDFGRRIVVSITIPDDACPPTLEGFDRDGDVFTPHFVETEELCVEPLIPKTYVVAFDRAQLPRSFTLRLPGDPTYGFDEARLTLDLG
jgi:hypothetical protein